MKKIDLTRRLEKKTDSELVEIDRKADKSEALLTEQIKTLQKKIAPLVTARDNLIKVQQTCRSLRGIRKGGKCPALNTSSDRWSSVLLIECKLKNAKTWKSLTDPNAFFKKWCSECPLTPEEAGLKLKFLKITGQEKK